MAWHQGYPLSQTLFTSVYAEALLTPTPRTVEDARFVRNALILLEIRACWKS